MTESLIERVKKLGIAFEENLPLSQYTTFRVGGKCPLAVFPENAAECSAVLAILNEEHAPYFVLGNGSNILASDRGYSGVLIMTERMRRISCEKTRIRCGARCFPFKVLLLCVRKRLERRRIRMGNTGKRRRRRVYERRAPMEAKFRILLSPALFWMDTESMHIDGRQIGAFLPAQPLHRIRLCHFGGCVFIKTGEK